MSSKELLLLLTLSDTLAYQGYLMDPSRDLFSLFKKKRMLIYLFFKRHA